MKSTIVILTSAFISSFAAIHAAPETTKPYPKDVCIVSDNKLGSMGRVITKTYQGQEVKFCCKPCVKKFDKAPEKYLGKLSKKK